MSYEPLHHKYRPQTFADLVGQDAIATTLTNAIRQNKIAPAYLFSGPRGTGKTSSARILAKSLNCLNEIAPTDTPCGKCDVCHSIANGSSLDVIEIDAASNTGVDNIRELIERAQFAPVQCRHKVYIIDECHMLSTAAFNSLLKTLEEPPDRVVFVLATTDPQRVLATIISRCQRFDFRRIPLDAMVQHLKNIGIEENIDITDEAVLTIAQIAQGGLRDAESLLDQLSLLQSQVTVERVWDLVGAVPERDLMKLLEAIASDCPEAVLDHSRELMNRGREPLVVLQNLASFYRDLLIAKTAPTRSDLVALTPPTWKELCQVATQHWDIPAILKGQQHLRTCEVQIKNTTQPRLWLEVTLLGLLPTAINTQTSERQPLAPARLMTSATGTQPPPESSQNHSAVQHQQAQPIAPASHTSANAVSQTPVKSPNLPHHEGDEPTRTASREEPRPPTAAGVRSPQSAPDPSPDSVKATELDGIWQSVLAHLSLASKALLKQHGYLLAFNDQQAEIAIRSPNLFKMAQSKLPDMEAAFLKAFNQKVRVKLHVGGGSVPQSVSPRDSSLTESSGSDRPSSATQSSAPEIEPMDRTSPPTASQIPITQTQNKDRSLHIQPSAPQISITSPASSRLQPAAADEIRDRQNIALDFYGEDDEVMVAAKRFATFFNGELVMLPDDIDTTHTESGEYTEEYALGELNTEDVSTEELITPLDEDPYGGLDF